MEQIIIENGGTTGISNYSAVVAAVKERLSTYEGLVVPEEAIPQAKQEVANLRRIAKNASDLRISVKREHEAKITETINQLKEITDLYTEAANKIDTQIKEYEKKAEEEKEEKIRAYWDSVIGKLAPFLSIKTAWNPKWLNKTYQMAQIQVDIDRAIEIATKGMRSIHEMNSPHEQTLLRTLFSTLDMQRVLDEKSALDDQLSRIEEDRIRREEERLRQESDAQIPSQLPSESIYPSEAQSMPEEQKIVSEANEKQYTLCFKVTATRNQILALREFLIANNIKFEKGE